MLLTDEGLRRARMRAQLLDPSADAGRRRTVADVVSTTVGIQAQDEWAARFSIRARASAGLLATDVDRALTEDRSLVLTWSLRGTRHFHHADDVRWLLGLLGPVFNRPAKRAAQLGIAGDIGASAVRVLDRALAIGGPLTRPEVKELLAPHGVDPTGQATVHILRRAALEGVICVLPGSAAGREPERYVRLDDWLPRRADEAAGPVGAGEETAAAELVRRYLAPYGPATPADFAAWSGLPARQCAAAWAVVAGDLRPVDAPTVPTGPASVLATMLDSVEAASSAGPVPLRLAGGFDNALLAYADRSAHLKAEHAREVNRGGGMIRPVMLDDGQVVGTWAYRGLTPGPFGPLTPRQHHDLSAEVAALQHFIGQPAVGRSGHD